MVLHVFLASYRQFYNISTQVWRLQPLKGLTNPKHSRCLFSSGLSGSATTGTKVVTNVSSATGRELLSSHFVFCKLITQTSMAWNEEVG